MINVCISFSQCTIFSILLALAFLAGGIPSAVNAADVQEDYLDRFRCDEIQDLPDNFSPDVREAKEQCDYIEQLRNSQAAAAVSLLYIYSNLCMYIRTYVILEPNDKFLTFQ